MKRPLMILLAFVLAELGALLMFATSVHRGAVSPSPAVAAGRADDGEPADRTPPPRPLQGTAARLAPANAGGPIVTAPAIEPGQAATRHTLAQLFADQADEVCACETQACVDDTLKDYASAMSDAASSKDDVAAMQTAAERMAKCRHEQETKWGLPSSDNHPLSVSDNTGIQEQAK